MCLEQLSLFWCYLVLEGIVELSLNLFGDGAFFESDLSVFRSPYFFSLDYTYIYVDIPIDI